MSGVATAVGAVAAVGGAYISSKGAQKAANAQGRAYDAATAEQARQYDLTREDMAPYREAGVNALAKLQDPNAFEASPSYQFVKDQGMQGIERSAAAGGSVRSGNALTALAQYNSGLASQEYGNWFNQQAAIAGAGQTATNALASVGQSTANNISSNLIGSGNARASGVADSANAWGNALGTVGGIASNYFANRKQNQMWNSLQPVTVTARRI